MKKLSILILALAVSADAQTVTTLRAKHNARVCALAGLPANCTQAEFDSTGKATGTIYTTDASFRDAVIVRRVLDEETVAEIQADAAIINAAVVRASNADALAAWCRVNNKPAGAMCAASDTRETSQRILTAAGLFAEKQAEHDKLAQERLRKQRKATLLAIEVAITDDATRAAVCLAAKIDPRDCR